MGQKAALAKTASPASAAPISSRQASCRPLFPDAPSSAESAPPALTPVVTIHSALPGMTPALWRMYRTAAFKSTLAAPQAAAQEGQAPAGAPGGAAPSFKPPTCADDTLMYVFGPAYRNPFITSSSQPDGADISRHAIEFKHIDAWRYGHNLVEIIIKKSSDVEPAAGGGDGTLGL